MNKTPFKYVLVSFILAWAQTASANADFFSKFEDGRLPKLSPPRVEVRTFKNGMTCFLLEDLSLPMVRTRVIAKAGRIYDPPGKAGLADLTAGLLKTGGTAELSPSDYDSAVEDMGAIMSVDVDAEMASLSMEMLSSDSSKGLSLLFQPLISPRFDKERLLTAKLSMEEALRREDDDPSMLASYKFRQLVYGADSPWARRPAKSSLSAIKGEDLANFHRNNYGARNLIFVAAGNFETERLLELVSKLTSQLHAGAEPPAVQPVELAFKDRFNLIERPTTQSYVRMGHLGLKRRNPDKYAMLILTDILGGGSFKSRLMEDIRTKKGYAYSIWSKQRFFSDYGYFEIGVNTKSALTNDVIGLIKGHIERLTREKDVTAGELDFAKRALLTSMVFEFDTAFKVADGEARYFFYGYPRDYWRIYRDGIARVTADDIYLAAAKYLHPDALDIMVVGPKMREPK